MVFVEVLSFLTAVLLLTAAATQVLLPLIQRKPLFPIFRSKRRRLEGDLADANERRELAAVEREVTKAEIATDETILGTVKAEGVDARLKKSITAEEKKARK